MTSSAVVEKTLRELGRLVFNFNAAEHSFRRLLWLMINPADERIGQIVTDGLDLARSGETIRQIAGHRKLGEALMKEIESQVAEFDQLRQTRNKFVHGFWRIPNDATDLTQMEAAQLPRRRTADYQSVPGSNDPATIETAASLAAKLGNSIDDTLEKVRAALVAA